MAALIERTRFDQAQIAAVAATAEREGYFEISERRREELVVSESALGLGEDGLPERRAIREISEAGGEMDVSRLAAWAESAGLAVHEVLRWGQARGWLRREKGAEDKPVRVFLTEAGKRAIDAPDDDERALRFVSGGQLFLDQLPEHGIDPDRVRELLRNRSEVARIKPRTQRTLFLTEVGAAALDRGVEVRQERNVLTPEDLQSGAWREMTLRPYDVTLPAREIYPAKIHPLRKIIEETRHTFLEMGFTEVASPMVESAFWNFDALFQPQDHPARDMQDTFYMEHPDRVALPPAELVDRVRRTHEDGWETGSEGWGYRWDAEQARRVVLRTHTTAATIRALSRHPEPPLKVFCVGWTCRNETISYKHLPVFHQVDGVVIDTEANLATLLGTLREFYRKMGFDRVKFKPAFYPYTEPSADVVVYMPSRGKWIEMGGSGIFRPEVTLPFGCRHAVLAWGLGIERLAMLRFGFESIRELYQGSLDRLEEVPLCR
jgi:phenylalanyl-tRNA synthetase alpha chain